MSVLEHSARVLDDFLVSSQPVGPVYERVCHALVHGKRAVRAGDIELLVVHLGLEVQGVDSGDVDRSGRQAPMRVGQHGRVPPRAGLTLSLDRVRVQPISVEPPQVPERHVRHGRVGVEGVVRRAVAKHVVGFDREGHEPGVKVGPDEQL